MLVKKKKKAYIDHNLNMSKMYIKTLSVTTV